MSKGISMCACDRWRVPESNSAGSAWCDVTTNGYLFNAVRAVHMSCYLGLLVERRDTLVVAPVRALWLFAASFVSADAHIRLEKSATLNPVEYIPEAV